MTKSIANCTAARINVLFLYFLHSAASSSDMLALYCIGGGGSVLLRLNVDEKADPVSLEAFLNTFRACLDRMESESPSINGSELSLDIVGFLGD